jgi:uncharacterized protein YndB with AHSA1/START domain
MIRRSVLLRCAPDRAFALFTEQASAWWPASRRHTGDPGSEIRMLASGRFWERGSDGKEVDLGRVRTWEPPHRLVLDFYVGTDAEHPTLVEVSFAAEGGTATRVTVEHRPTPLSEELWQQRAPTFDRSWELLLEALAGTIP